MKKVTKGKRREIPVKINTDGGKIIKKNIKLPIQIDFIFPQ